MTDQKRPATEHVRCAICGTPFPDPEFARNYPNLVCRECDGLALTGGGDKPRHESAYDDGDNPVFIGGIKCWRRYRFGGFVTMRDSYNCGDISEFYERHGRVG